MAEVGQRREQSLGMIAKAGAAAGVLGGASMLLFVMIATGWRGLGFLAPVQAFAGVLLGRDALGGGWGTSLLGLAVHGVVSASLGVLFTAVALRRTGPVESVGAGVVLAVIAWPVLTYVVVPLTNPALRQLTSEAPIAWFGGHVVFGMVVASARQLVDVLQRRALANASAAPPEPVPPVLPMARLEPHGEAQRAPRSRLRVAARAGTLVAAVIGLAWLGRHAEA